MKSKGSKAYVVISACSVLLFCALCLVILDKILTGNINDMVDWLSILLFSSYLFAMAWVDLQVETRKCKITQDGIRVKYPLSTEKLFAWEQLQQICLCFKPLKKRYIPQKFTDQEIICFVLKKAKKNSWGLWDIYSIRYFQKILFIHYTEENMEKLQELCPMSIIDLRNDKIYQNRE